MPWTARSLNWRPSFLFSSQERFGNHGSGCPPSFVSKLKAPFLLLNVEKEMLFYTGCCCYHPHLASECKSPASQITGIFTELFLFYLVHGHIYSFISVATIRSHLICLSVRMVPEEPPYPWDPGFEREKHGYPGHLHSVNATGTIRILSHYRLKPQALKITRKTASQNNVMT